MPNSISNVESISKQPQLEVDENFEAKEIESSLDQPASETIERKGGKSKIGLLALVLGMLLLASVAINFQQARVTSALQSESRQFESALIEAIGTVGQETDRANAAEASLSGIGGAVDTVNDRIESLQQALGELRSATSR